MNRRHRMNRFHRMSGLSSLIAAGLLLSAPSFSAEPLRRIHGCMIRRMKADRFISYNDAKAACLAQLAAPADTRGEARVARTETGIARTPAGAVPAN